MAQDMKVIAEFRLYEHYTKSSTGRQIKPRSYENSDGLILEFSGYDEVSDHSIRKARANKLT